MLVIITITTGSRRLYGRITVLYRLRVNNQTSSNNSDTPKYASPLQTPGLSSRAIFEIAVFTRTLISVIGPPCLSRHALSCSSRPGVTKIARCSCLTGRALKHRTYGIILLKPWSTSFPLRWAYTCFTAFGWMGTKIVAVRRFGRCAVTNFNCWI